MPSLDNWGKIIRYLYDFEGVVLKMQLTVVGNEKEGGGGVQEGGKWQELASDCGDRGLFAL